MSGENPSTVGEKASTQGAEGAIPPGKIYADSINIYDDEARVAFDYFKKAASKIVADEDRINALKSESDAKCAVMRSAKFKSVAGLALCLLGAIVMCVGILSNAGPQQRPAAFLALLPLGFFLYFLIKLKKTAKELEEEIAVGQKLTQDFANIKRDYKINKLGVAYVPVATSVPFEDKSFVLDDTGSAEQIEFSLYQMNAQEEFLATLGEIKKGKDELPVVETGDATEDVQTGQMSESLESVRLHDYIGGLDRNLRTVSYLLNDLKKTSVSLPVIDPKGEYARFIETYCAEDVGGNPVLEVFTQRRYAEELKRFDELNQIRKRIADENAKLEKMLQEFIVDVSDYVQLMSRSKLTSVSKIVDFSNTLLLNTFKASYNHYSTLLESAEIKRIQEDDFDYKSGEGEYRPFKLSPASKVRFDPISGNWVSEDGGRTSYPFGIHQIQEEIIAPLVQNLLKETRTERLKIYNNIMDQKRDYLNQWHRDTDDFYGRGRAESSEIITQMQTTLAEFNTAVSQYKAYEDTEKKMIQAGDEDLDSTQIKASGTGTAFSIAYCEEQTRQIRQQQDEFNDYIARLNEDIDRRAAEFGYTKFYDASLRDGHAKEVAMSLLGVGGLNERQKMLLAANAYIATNAQLPPEPVVDSSVYGTLGTNLNKVVADTIAELEAGAKSSKVEDGMISDTAVSARDDEDSEAQTPSSTSVGPEEANDVDGTSQD